MRKVVIFDWGGVVESHENNLQELNKAIVRTIRKFNRYLSDNEILERWTIKNSKGILIGATNREQDIKDWVDTIEKNMNIHVTFEEFRKAYEEETSSIKYYKNVVEYVHSLKDRCEIAILSNLTPFDKKRINKQYDLSQFNYVYLSFEIGMRKPDEKVYKYVLNDLKIAPNQILFIDDDIENISTAKNCGWNTCQAFGYEIYKIKQSVENFLIK